MLFSLKKCLPFLIFSVIFSFFIGGGLILLFIPGIIAFTYLIFASFVFVLRNNSKPIYCLKYSFNLVKGYAWKTFSITLAIFLTYLLLKLSVDGIAYKMENFVYIQQYSRIFYEIFLSFIIAFSISILVILMINLEAMKGYYEEIDEDNNNLENLTTNNN